MEVRQRAAAHDQTVPARSRAVPLLAVSHACVDVYQGSVAALVPFFVTERAYGYAAAAGVVLAASLLSSLVQPLFGALTDRWAMPWLLPVSTVVGGAGVALVGVSGTYALTLAAVALSGIGVAAYHPEAARMARLAAGRSHEAMGWFSLGGNLGFATAPLLVGVVVATGGLGASPLLIVPALVGPIGGAIGTVAGGHLATRFGRLGVIDPAVMTTRLAPITVELTGVHTRGMTIADLRGPAPPDCHPRVAVDLDHDRFWDLVIDALERIGEP